MGCLDCTDIDELARPDYRDGSAADRAIGSMTAEHKSISEMAPDSGAAASKPRTVEVAPRATVLIESMRDIGYSLDTALADIIDNSVTAKASHVQMFADEGEGEFRIAILDDGTGMTETELLAAMRPGSRSPLESRPSEDLGRFGLGLKTASFSQCRRLTVVTRRDGSTSAARWDLDFVAEVDAWLIQLLDDVSSVPWVNHLAANGTLVLWEKLDRVVGNDALDSHRRFTSSVDSARDHLELVFHRFLSGESGRRCVRMSMNGVPLEGIDPFCRAHQATLEDPEERIQLGEHEVRVVAFTLPHHAKVSKAEWDRNAGKEGYLQNQGFYVYRNRRLIVHGTWFGLMRQREITKLARVRVDIPTGLDAQWRIDVKKASAQPPHAVRIRLRKIIERIAGTSKVVYRSRGRRLVNADPMPVWIRVVGKGEVSYRLNDEHPSVAGFRQRLAPELQREFLSILELAAASLPMAALFADLGGDPTEVSANELSDEALSDLVRSAARTLHSGGLERSAVETMFANAEPFTSNVERARRMLDEIYSTGEL